MVIGKTAMVAVVCALVAVTCAVVLGQRQSSASASGPLGVAAGGYHTCVLTAAGGVECWGLNDFGQLGDGTTANSSIPVGVLGLGSGVVAISAGGYHTCALISSGGVECWGRNGYGQLGNGTTVSSAIPVDVSGLESGVVAVSAGGFHTCALTTAGSLKCWGQNNRGQLGDGTGTNRTTPVDVAGYSGGAAATSAGGGELLGGGHSCALSATGGVECWGRNDYGQLGDGTTGDSVSPVPVFGLSSGMADVRAGRWHTCGRTSGGGVKCWGWNIAGQLGSGTENNSSTPVDVVGLGDGVEALTAGGSHNCALTASGGVKCWGRNDVGQVGDGTTTYRRLAPVDVLEAAGGSPLLGVTAVAAGGSTSTYGHTCAVMESGAVKCWGSNEFGQLGDGTTSDSASPVDVVGYAPKPTPTATADPPTPVPTDTLPPATIEDLFDDLGNAVDGLDVPGGVRNSLGAKLDAALSQAQRGRPCTAANQAGSFIHDVEALLRSGRITSDEASALIAQAESIVELLREEGDCPR